MGNPLPVPPPGFSELSSEEKLEYVQALWDHISADLEDLPLTDWQKQLLDERLDDLEKNPDSSIPWSVVRSNVLRKLGKK
jgi:putative addiction module component (TIGR02574 family)